LARLLAPGACALALTVFVFPGTEARADEGRLRGEISFNRQKPVVGANVVGTHEGDPGRLLLGVTDMHGYFRFESIPAGNWTLDVYRDGAMPVSKKGIVVAPPARCVVDLLMISTGGRPDPPPVDLARFETASTEVAPDQRMIVEVWDPELRPIIDARVSLRSRGPKVDPLRGAADAEGVARLRAPEPGEYTFKVEVPGYLPARIERLVLGRKAPRVTVVLTPRPLDYPARPAELLPEERAVPPEGFPGSSENAAPAAGVVLPAPPGTASTAPVPPRP